MKVAILTGGGDCPGLNAVIRAVVRTIHNAGGECVGLLNARTRGEQVDRGDELAAGTPTERTMVKACCGPKTRRWHDELGAVIF